MPSPDQHNVSNLDDHDNPFPTDTSSRRSHFFSAVTVSLLVHCVVAVAALTQLTDIFNRMQGAGGGARESLGVELVSEAELDSLLLKFTTAAASANGADAASTLATPPEPEQKSPAEAAQATPDAQPPPLAGVGEQIQNQPAQAEMRPTLPDAPQLVAAPSPAATFPGTLAASRATAGELSRFGLEVRTALGRYRPKHAGARGSVQVSFALDEVGQAHKIVVARSSGNSRLDDLALNAIRQTQFPIPPPGSTDAQRLYVVPYIFK
jgi:TonB family protein